MEDSRTAQLDNGSFHTTAQLSQKQTQPNYEIRSHLIYSLVVVSRPSSGAYSPYSVVTRRP
jgi:hypothetical protein